MADTLCGKFTKCAKVCGLFFLDYAFWMLIDWGGKLRSHGKYVEKRTFISPV